MRKNDWTTSKDEFIEIFRRASLFTSYLADAYLVNKLLTGEWDTVVPIKDLTYSRIGPSTAKLLVLEDYFIVVEINNVTHFFENGKLTNTVVEDVTIEL